MFPKKLVLFSKNMSIPHRLTVASGKYDSTTKLD